MYLKASTIKWALGELNKVPRDQAALFYFLIFNSVNLVKRGTAQQKSKFETEFYKYFGGPLKGGGVGCFNPFDGRWMAEEYINSTVYGRLLNGSHWWTDSNQGFFDRNPPTQFPAEIKISSRAFDNLDDRTTSPCLKSSSLLPMSAVAVLYYRYEELNVNNSNNLTDVVNKFQNEILSTNKQLKQLFSSGATGPLTPYQKSKPSEDEIMSVYPPCPYKGESQVNVRLYVDDVNAVKRQLGLTIDQFSEFFRKIIREKGIY